MKHQRIGLRPFQNGVLTAGQVIGGPRVGEWEGIGDVEVILVLLAAGHDWVGEPVVHPLPTSAGDVRHDAVEHPPAGRVGVVAAIDEVPQAAPGLRAAPGIGHLRAA